MDMGQARSLLTVFYLKLQAEGYCRLNNLTNKSELTPALREEILKYSAIYLVISASATKPMIRPTSTPSRTAGRISGLRSPFASRKSQKWRKRRTECCGFTS